MYVAVARKHGAQLDRLSGTIQNDILKEYLARGTQIYPPRFSLRLITDVFAYCRDEVPNWNTISISGYHIREAGSTAVQELAFTFGNAIAYVQAALDRGLRIDDFGPRLSFFFAAHNDFLEEIAKFRAARRIWARIARERFGAANSKAMMLRFHAQTAGSTLAAQQPANNVVRVALQAMAAALGGAQSMHTNSQDEALALPTEDAARLALRTQQVIAFESGIVNTADPAGGAYAIESLTDAIERDVFAVLARIDGMGGMLAAIESGWAQREIQESAYQYQRAIEKRERLIVGLNAFESADETPIPIHVVDPELERAQIERLRRARAERNAQDVSQALNDLEAAARSEANLMPGILRAVEAYATIGEISDVFRKVHGEYRESA
jgi:methylmalonyl-CoA mutase N-terminal domain/subunit